LNLILAFFSFTKLVSNVNALSGYKNDWVMSVIDIFFLGLLLAMVFCVIISHCRRIIFKSRLNNSESFYSILNKNQRRGLYGKYLDNYPRFKYRQATKHGYIDAIYKYSNDDKQSLQTYIAQRNNKRRRRRRGQARSLPSTSPLCSAPPIPSAPIPHRSEPVVELEVNVQIHDTPNLLTVTQNDLNECDSQSVTSLPTYEIATKDQQLPTYEEAVVLAHIQHKK